jgi:phosphoadenosine phosphosulfate reductase
MEPTALKYQEFGYHVAFSGGKDSQVIYELCKMAGVKFKAFFYKTSVDPKELLSFIRNNYKDVEWIRPKMTMFQLIEKKGILPLRNVRYCCEFLKERNGLNSVIITGVRKDESKRRSKTPEFDSSCKIGKDKNLLNPILEWTKDDVFTFLLNRNISICSLYLTQDRIGCIGCPMNPKTQRSDFRLHPNFKKAYINTVKKIMNRGKYPNFESAEDVVNWWQSGLSIKRWFANKFQTKLDL